MSKPEEISTNTISTCKMNLECKITYANEELLKISGYSAVELMNESYEILKHSDMPEIIYKEARINLEKGLNFNIISINQTKQGKCYWTVNNLTINKDSEGNKIGITTRRKPVPKAIIEKIKPFYNDLLEIEKCKGMDASKSYFEAYLREEIGKSYQNHLIDLFHVEAPKELKDTVGQTLNWFFTSEYVL